MIILKGKAKLGYRPKQRPPRERYDVAW